MLDIGSNDKAAKPKCYFTHTVLPQWIDEKSAPSKRKPFSTILAQPFSHSLDIIIPDSASSSRPGASSSSSSSRAALQAALETALKDFTYSTVHLTLSDILSGAFFTRYIKTGNIALLASPVAIATAAPDASPATDPNPRQAPAAHLESLPSLSLTDGILRLELDKATYERAGLVGRPVVPGGGGGASGKATFERERGAGRKHVPVRYVVECNLRLPSMLHGRKGFERLRWAAENVLTERRVWLFCDLDALPGCGGTGKARGQGADREMDVDVDVDVGETTTAGANQDRDQEKVLAGNEANDETSPLVPFNPRSHHPTISTTTSRSVLIPTLPTTFPTSCTSNSSQQPAPSKPTKAPRTSQAEAPARKEALETTLDLALSLREYLGLLAIESPRVLAGDRVDPLLSRYEVPRLSVDNDGLGRGATEAAVRTGDVAILRVRGFLPAAVVARVFRAAVRAVNVVGGGGGGGGGGAAAAGGAASSADAEESADGARNQNGEWFALRVEGFGSGSYTVLKSGDTAMVWECE